MKDSPGRDANCHNSRHPYRPETAFHRLLPAFAMNKGALETWKPLRVPRDEFSHLDRRLVCTARAAWASYARRQVRSMPNSSRFHPLQGDALYNLAEPAHHRFRHRLRVCRHLATGSLCPSLKQTTTAEQAPGRVVPETLRRVRARARPTRHTAKLVRPHRLDHTRRMLACPCRPGTVNIMGKGQETRQQRPKGRGRWGFPYHPLGVRMSIR